MFCSYSKEYECSNVCQMIQKFEFDFVLSMFACVCVFVCYFCVYAYICMLLVCKFVCKCMGVYVCERERERERERDREREIP